MLVLISASIQSLESLELKNLVDRAIFFGPAGLKLTKYAKSESESGNDKWAVIGKFNHF